MQLSIVIPCLNEEETIGICIEKCLQSFKKLQISSKAEIIIADNGSSDNSIKIARDLGAKIVNVEKKGYGNALTKGIEAAKGEFIIMGDADNSYDFNEIHKFYEKLLEGNDMVQGCRFSVGGGKIENNAMPFLHKYFGNPFFSLISKIFFSLPFNDVYCGFRGFNRNKFLNLNHFSKGMVFAIENLIKFNVAKHKSCEIPITLHKDGRINSKSHLKTFTDGWKTLKFLLIACPKWLYFIPSLIFLIISVWFGLEFFLKFSKNSNLENFNKFNSMFIYFLLSFQIFMFGIFSSLLSIKLRLSKSKFIEIFFKLFKLRYAFFLSFLIFFCTLIEKYFFNLINVDKLFIDTIYDLTIFFCFILIANSLFISLLTIDE